MPIASLLCAASAVMTFAAANVAPVPPPGSDERWLADPVVWTALSPTSSQVQGPNIAADLLAAPVASNVVVEATLVPKAATGDGWCVIGLAIRENEARHWRLNLVRSPIAESGRRFFELGQLLDGRWPSPVGWRVVRSETAPVAWREDEPLRFRLELAEERVLGEIRDADGRRLFFREYSLGPGAVRCGRPAIMAHEMTAEVRDVRAGWSNPVPASVREWPPYVSDSFVPDVTGPTRGVFQVTRDDTGRWWAVDPLGRGMVILGVDHVSYRGHWCEALGYAPYGRKNDARYPDRSVWESQTVARLISWGFNALGAGSEVSLAGRGLAYSINLNLGTAFCLLGPDHYITPNEGRPCTAFPNVYHPKFAAWARYQALRRCAPNRGDPRLIGYFLDNELAWWGRWTAAPADLVSATGLFDAAMRLSASNTAKQAACELVRRHAGNDLDKARATWRIRLDNWEHLISLAGLPSETPEQIEIKTDFLRQTARRYFEVLVTALRAADPDHMVLGCRFAGTAGAHPVVWEAAGGWCDVVSLNIYPFADLDTDEVVTRLEPHRREPLTSHLTRYQSYCNRPLLITEWSFPALDSGLPCLHGAGQRFHTQAERARASELFARTVLSLPFVIGYNYFMWVDEPALGISTNFPEDSNYGLVNEDDQPYEMLTAMFTRLHREAVSIRRGPPPAPRPPPARSPIPSAADFIRSRSRELPPAPEARNGVWLISAGPLVLTTDPRTTPPWSASLSGDIGGPIGTVSIIMELVDEKQRSRWIEASALQSCDVSGDDAGALRCAVRPAGPNPPFECELTVRSGGEPWLTFELTAVRNLTSAPIRIQSVYFAARPQFEGEAEPRPPNLWKAIEAHAWLEDPAPKRFWGAIAPPSPFASVRFWRHAETGRPHADARWIFEPPPTVPSQERYEPASRPWMVLTGGVGGLGEWRRHVEQFAPR